MRVRAFKLTALNKLDVNFNCQGLTSLPDLVGAGDLRCRTQIASDTNSVDSQGNIGSVVRWLASRLLPGP